MRRPTRWTLNALTALSVAVFAAAVFLWCWCHDGHRVEVQSYRGAHRFGVEVEYKEGVVCWLGVRRPEFRDAAVIDDRPLAFGFYCVRRTFDGWRDWFFAVPFWAWVAAGAVPPIARMGWRSR